MPRGWRYDHNGLKLSRRILIAYGFFHAIDLVEFVLKINAAKKEGHHSAEAKAKGFGTVEVPLQRVTQVEAGNQADDPAGDRDKSAEGALMMWRLVMRDGKPCLI